jgi:hypothetical protein
MSIIRFLPVRLNNIESNSFYLNNESFNLADNLKKKNSTDIKINNTIRCIIY